MAEIKLFNKWDFAEVTVQDPGLRNYINLKPIMIPRTGGRNASQRFYKTRYSIVERLINKLMVTGHKGKKHKYSSGRNTGKAIQNTIVVKKMLEILEKEKNMNPLLVLVKAIENAAPREEITTIEYGGARYPQSVECSPQRRIDITLRQMAQGAYSKAIHTKKSLARTLANEVLAAYKIDQASQAISKKLELERQADSAR